MNVSADCAYVASSRTATLDDCQNPVIQPRPSQLYVVPPNRITELQRTDDVEDALTTLQPAAVAYDGPGHYMAFVVGYLEDIGALEPVEAETADKLDRGVRHALFSFYDPALVDLSRLDPSKFDEDQVAREFFAGPIREPNAGRRLLEAVRILREDLAGLPEGNLLLVRGRTSAEPSKGAHPP